MKVIRSVGVIVLLCAFSAPATAQKKAAGPPKPQISQATREKAADENANPDALVLADFQKRIDAYMAIQKDAAKDVPSQKETNDATKIKAVQEALGAKIRAARATAKSGDILTPEVRNKFRRLMYPVVQGPAAQGTSGSAKAVKADVKDELKENSEEQKEEGGRPVVLKVNATYPPDAPLPSTPPQVLMNLPKLPEQLEYRIVGKTLIIRDVDANIIVDFVPNAIQ
jgi:ribosomal protein L12E/L44/L45/RPP1/RPP2